MSAIATADVNRELRCGSGAQLMQRQLDWSRRIAQACVIYPPSGNAIVACVASTQADLRSMLYLSRLRDREAGVETALVCVTDSLPPTASEDAPGPDGFTVTGSVCLLKDPCCSDVGPSQWHLSHATAQTDLTVRRCCRAPTGTRLALSNSLATNVLMTLQNCTCTHKR